MNGQVNSGAAINTDRVFRSHDRPTISVPELAAMQRGYLERLGTIVERLSTVVIRADTVTAAHGWPSRNETVTNSPDAPWSVLTSEPFASVAVNACPDHLQIDLKSTSGNVRLTLARRDIPTLLKTLIDAVGRLAAESG